MEKLQLDDISTIIEWGIILYPCKIEQVNGNKTFSFPRNGEQTKEWKWIQESPQLDPAEIYKHLENGYDLAGILPENTCVLDCDNTEAFEYIYELLCAFKINPVSEKSFSYSDTCQKHHFFFSTSEPLPYMTKFQDIGLKGKGELLGAGHLIFFNKNGWYMRPNECTLAPLPIELPKSKPVKKHEPTQNIILISGERNNAMASFAGGLRRKGASNENVFQCLKTLNSQCSPPLADQELSAIAFSICRYPPKPLNNSIENIKMKMKGLL
ncbi:primase alpha helix C-terminal domain-containing protein [bacterium]|nr:primase alpha helix C-terminal domain-containing protein [bacterium]